MRVFIDHRHNSLETVDPLSFFGSSELGMAARDIDWEKTPLGSPGEWSASLRRMIGMLFHSKHPMLLFWGIDLICFYNDALKESLGDKRQPKPMGRRGK